MMKRMICIECPKGCALSVDIENCKVKSVEGAKCPKGTAYAITEAENPSRALTATVLTNGLSLKLVSVRTDKAIPKKDLLRAMKEIRKMRIRTAVKSGGVIAKDFLGLGVRLLATREVREVRGWYSMRLSVLLIILSIAAAGCATMRFPGAYKVEGREFNQFKELDDERALKVVALIYNIKFEGWEDNIARSIVLEEYLNLLKKRGSRYVKKSGIFNIQYDKVKLAAWKDEDLVKLYDNLAPKADGYYMDSAHELTETQNSQRIIYLTAVNSIDKELKKRHNTRTAIAVAGDILIGALTVAVSMI